jgi:hypothetical protein
VELLSAFAVDGSARSCDPNESQAPKGDREIDRNEGKPSLEEIPTGMVE